MRMHSKLDLMCGGRGAFLAVAAMVAMVVDFPSGMLVFLVERRKLIQNPVYVARLIFRQILDGG
jgi:hypothetical protein